MKKYKSNVPKVRMLLEPTTFKKVKISSSKDAAKFLKEIWPEDLNYRECFVALFLNRNNNTIAFSEISSGGLHGTVADLKIIFQQALLSHASGIILAHNHPSGNLKASPSDRAITTRAIEFGKMIEMNILDHIILTEDGYLSFGDEGMI